VVEVIHRWNEERCSALLLRHGSNLTLCSIFLCVLSFPFPCNGTCSETLKLKLYLASASVVLGPLAFTMQASHNEKVQLFELPVCCGMFILGTPVSHGLIESCENIEYELACK